MKTLRTLFSLMILLALAQFAKAQMSYSDVNTVFMSEGEIKAGHKPGRYADVEGDPYLYKGWLPGTAKLADGKLYTKLLLMYDEVDGLPIFKNNPTDSAMSFSPRAVEFQLALFNASDGSMHLIQYKSGFAPVDGLNSQTYYRVLEEGKMSLLKHTVKAIVKHTSYGTNDITRSIEATDEYYLALANKPVKVKNNNKAVLAVMADKGAEVKAYIDSKSLNVKNDNDFIAVVKYYNTL